MSTRGAELAWARLLVRRLLLLLLPLSLIWARSARADSEEQRLRSHLLEQVRIGIAANMASGSHLVGVGSRERYTLGSGDLQIYITRFFNRRWGVTIDLTFTPPLPDRDTLMGRGEAGVDVAIASWTGRLPGSWIASVGIGADVGRYWYAGRGYPYAMTRLRLWPRQRVSVQLQDLVVPLSIGTSLPTWENRVELSTSYDLLQFGFRVGYASATGGDPVRTYTQQELSAFIAIVVM